MREQWAEREREMERRERTRSEREWDRDKIREGPRSRSRDRRRKEHAKSKEKKNEKKGTRVTSVTFMYLHCSYLTCNLLASILLLLFTYIFFNLPLTEKVQEEPPAKLLDDLFHKTKAAPCIYWLPLTDDQV